MRFSCEGCNAKYMISDDKVGPAGVKVRCKKCGHVTLVRKGEPEAAAPHVAAPGVEWWVAIDEQPVGPVGLEVVQHHWDQGEIGPESLVWYAGLAEWTPIGSVPELHGHLTGGHPPVHQPPPTPPPEPAAAPAAAPGAPSEEWFPDATAALAALEEPEAKGAAPAPATPAADVAPALVPTPPPEAGSFGTDPTGVHPLPMAGLERTGERRIGKSPGLGGPMARPVGTSSPSRESRTLPVALLVALAVVAVVAAGLWWLTR